MATLAAPESEAVKSTCSLGSLTDLYLLGSAF